jgi:hypothetical protein
MTERFSANCKIIRVLYSVKCQCDRKEIKLFGKIFLLFTAVGVKAWVELFSLFFLTKPCEPGTLYASSEL